MRKYFIACLTLLSLQITIATAQDAKGIYPWITEVGPSLAIPIRTLHTATSFGVGGDLRISREVSSIKNFSAGARLAYNVFFGKKDQSTFTKGKTIHNIGLFASLQYIAYDNLVLEADVGLGITSGWFNTIGLARSGFIGYKLPDLKRNVKIGVFMSRITFATLHMGIKGTIQI